MPISSQRPLLRAALAPALLFSALLNLRMLAQVPKSSPYAAESAVITRSDSVFNMQPDGTGYRERTLAVRIQSEAALRLLGVLTVPFAGASEHVEIKYARVRRPDGTVIETPVADALEQPTAVTREAPFYSDLKEKQLPIRSLRVGDTLEWQARIIRTKAEAPNQFWGEETFDDTTISLADSVELHIPATTIVNVWTNPHFGGKPAVTTVADERIYRWQHTSLKPATGKEADADKEAKKNILLTPEQELDATQGKLPSIAWTTFPSWQAVGDWYRSLERERSIPDAGIKAKVAELTAGKSTQEEKARAVYSFVATQVRYIGVAFGVGRYQPHLASEVLANQYGDCKDKHTLLAAMLLELGLHPDAALIGAGIRFNEAVPSPSAFNHLITHLEVDGKPIWLDTTTEVAPYRMLIFPIRDKTALVIPATSTAHLEHTPKDPPFSPYTRMTAVGSIDQEGISTSHLSLTLRGDEETGLRAVLRQIAPAQYDEFVQRLSSGMGYGGTTSHAEFSSINDTSVPLTFSYDYHREKAGDWDNLKIIPQLLPVGLPVLDDKQPPTQSIALGVPATASSTAEMKIPAGWGVELPEAVHEKTAFATYDETYRFEKGTIYTERRLTTLKDKLPAAEWKSYKAWTDKVNLGSDMFIQLTRKDAASSSPPIIVGSGSQAPATASTEAAALIREAFQLLERRDFAGASNKLDEAKQLNADQKDLWGAYGAFSFDMDHMNEAAKFYQKELLLHPASVWVYSPLCRALLAAGHRADAQQFLRTWAVGDPTNTTPTLMLSSLLLREGDAKAARDELSKALAKLPEDRRNDSHLNLALGKAQLKSGMEAEGRATLVSVLKNTDDPLVMNDAAYELADAGHELPLAESTERKVLDKLGEESRTWTLNESPNMLQAKTSLLTASWDSMGWILFRAGKLDEAEDYVQASWINAQHPEVGEHLGDIRAARNNASGALTAYSLALASIRTGDDETETTLNIKSKLKAKIEKTKRAGSKAPEPKNGWRDDLTNLRKIPLGAANNLQGVAEYRVLLGAKDVPHVSATGDQFVKGGEALLLKQKFPHLFPAGSDARLARLAMLNCHANTCELIFEP